MTQQPSFAAARLVQLYSVSAVTVGGARPLLRVEVPENKVGRVLRTARLVCGLPCLRAQAVVLVAFETVAAWSRDLLTMPSRIAGRDPAMTVVRDLAPFLPLRTFMRGELLQIAV